MSADPKTATADDTEIFNQLVKDDAETRNQPKKKNKTAERLKWWQQINEVKPVLTLPALQTSPSSAPYELDDSSEGCQTLSAIHKAVASIAEDRLNRGKDWLVRDSDYGAMPAHATVKAKVNAALINTIEKVVGNGLPDELARDPHKILLLLDTPQYGTLSEIVAKFPGLRCCQQIVVPQADLGHYFEMIRSGQFYPGVRAQRLDHWLCANSGLGFHCVAAFLDFEIRLVGSLSARLCPAADIMRYFRFGYPAEPTSVLALTVGLEEPAATPERVDAFVRYEAALNGYSIELLETWKFRMVTMLYVIRRSKQRQQC